ESARAEGPENKCTTASRNPAVRALSMGSLLVPEAPPPADPQAWRAWKHAHYDNIGVGRLIASHTPFVDCRTRCPPRRRERRQSEPLNCRDAVGVECDAADPTR